MLLHVQKRCCHTNGRSVHRDFGSEMEGKVPVDLGFWLATLFVPWQWDLKPQETGHDHMPQCKNC